VDVGAGMEKPRVRHAPTRWTAGSYAVARTARPLAPESRQVASRRVPRRRALITGITGQDGWYLTELLLARDYEVIGMVRSPGAPVPESIAVVTGDLLEPSSLRAAIEATRPHELYHLAAPTFVPDSWEDPTETLSAIGGATATLLASARTVDEATRVWVSTSSEIFGDAGESPQNERSPMRPRSPYGVAKLAAHGLVATMRERFELFACSGITYNHESPRRPEQFLSRKVARGAAAMKLGLERELVLGDLDAVRDWSHAADVVEAAWLALQASAPDDYVIASGVGRPVRDFVAAAFAAVDLDWEQHVRTDPSLVRAPEPIALVGDPSRARERLGWRPQHSFDEMVAEMVEADLAALRS
jgi:GDPmannose 4,6-dehydratase